MTKLTLNVDLGELPDEPEELYRLCTVANVACGGHAGDAGSMRRAVRLARAGGAAVAAHPSYPDREGFGRRTMAIDPAALRSAIVVQLQTLDSIARDEHATLARVKPHGALYHDAGHTDAIAHALVDAVEEVLGRVEIVGPPGSGLAAHVRARGLGWVAEGFADRGYDDHGHILPRGTPGALIEDPARAAEQALSLARAGDVQTLCVHGDTPGAVAIARAVRSALEREGLLA